ncbi:MAG: FtsQ-type POTRA domain-containing protein [Acidobacteria bacterium]|nr:FtsQ-type POTRA domain-containing protein [Acidobacteriota bacterium]
MLASLLVLALAGAGESAPFQAPTGETVAEIRVHGNLVTPEDDIRQLAGARIGMPVGPQTTEEVAARLRATKRFRSVDVLKRFASIADPTQIVLVIVVDEGPVRIEATGDPNQPTRVVRSGGMNLLVLPVLRFEDGYGFTYGARVSVPDPAGARSRLSFPLTWGGEKRAAAELDKDFERGPVSRIGGGASMSRRTHPFFRADEDRIRVSVGAERQVVRSLRAGTTAGWQRVSFLDAEDQFVHVGADIVADTRLDQVLARNAVYGRISWERLAFRGGNAVNRSELEARGYLGLFGQSVLVIRARREDSDKPLPVYLKPMLGGLANLRGHRAGTAIGDTLVAGSTELRVPLTSPLYVGKIGVSVFTDIGTVYDKGGRLSEQPLKQGYGGGFWFSAAFLQLNVTVAHGRGGSTRLHAGGGVSF